MLVISNHIPVAPDWQEAFEQRFQNRAGKIDKQPGFVRLEILKPVDTASPYIVQTVWEDETAFQNWVESDDFKEAHSNPLPKEAVTGNSHMEMHNIIIKSP
ncbi:antibiotic biosynthesis monooxygenase family protein [Pseudomonadota bacterium]